MKAFKTMSILSVLIVFGLILSACGLAGPAAPPTTPADKLAEVTTRGRLVIASSDDYPPQSDRLPEAPRAANTKCLPTEFTAAEMVGFDIEVAAEIARRMGLEPCFVLPTWTQLVSGGWADRWDISVASMTITPERLQALYFAQPYYTTPAAFFIHKDNTTFKQASDLSGKRIGVCVGCTYEAFIKGTLVMPGQKVDFVVQNATATGYDIENSAIDDLSKGDGVQLDAVLTGIPLGQDMIKSGKPIKQLGEPVFIEYLGVAIDKKSNKDSVSLAKKVNEIIQQMHSDGTLLRLSQQYYGQDLTTAAGKFDLQSLNQFP